MLRLLRQLGWGALLGLSLALATPVWAQTEQTATSTQSEADEAAELEALLAESGGGPDAWGPGGLLRSFVETALVLGGVCLLAYLLLGKVLPRVLRIPAQAASLNILNVVDRLPLDQRRSLMVVQMGDQHFLLSSTEHGVNLLSRLDSSHVEEARLSAASRSDPAAAWSGLTKLLERRPAHEDSP